MNETILSVQNLNLWYGQNQALKDISMEIPEKSITAFIESVSGGTLSLLKATAWLKDVLGGLLCRFLSWEMTGSDTVMAIMNTTAASRTLPTVRLPVCILQLNSTNICD